jgi:hypothetical protein
MKLSLAKVGASMIKCLGLTFRKFLGTGRGAGISSVDNNLKLKNVESRCQILLVICMASPIEAGSL